MNTYEKFLQKKMNTYETLEYVIEAIEMAINGNYTDELPLVLAKVQDIRERYVELNETFNKTLDIMRGKI